MRFNQKGFTLVAGLLILIAIGLVAGTGYYVYNAQKTADQALSKASSDSTPQTSTQTPATHPTDTNTGFVAISEWGLEVKIGAPENGDRLTYKIHKDERNDDTAYFILSPNITEKCVSVGFAVHRSTVAVNGKYQKLGEGYYAPSGAHTPDCDKLADNEKAKTALEEISNSIDKMDYVVKVSP